MSVSRIQNLEHSSTLDKGNNVLPGAWYEIDLIIQCDLFIAFIALRAVTLMNSIKKLFIVPLYTLS